MFMFLFYFSNKLKEEFAKRERNKNESDVNELVYIF
jgi:hypothetical protein